uniref:Uncharacterized protein n=1 Tax=Myotis myotis TaxID=51298 RepID=A0A7J8AMG1_MYOMY|nr:hypothetical protein mMyoMyo1_007805 [Myotis myotis]
MVSPRTEGWSRGLPKIRGLEPWSPQEPRAGAVVSPRTEGWSLWSPQDPSPQDPRAGAMVSPRSEGWSLWSPQDPGAGAMVSPRTEGWIRGLPKIRGLESVVSPRSRGWSRGLPKIRGLEPWSPQVPEAGPSLLLDTVAAGKKHLHSICFKGPGIYSILFLICLLPLSLCVFTKVTSLRKVVSPGRDFFPEVREGIKLLN